MGLMTSGLRRKGDIEKLEDRRTEITKKFVPLKLLPITDFNIIFQQDNRPEKAYGLQRFMKKNMRRLNDCITAHYTT